MNGYDLLFYVGIALMGISTIGGILLFIVLRLSGKRLNAQLRKEFGERHR